MYNLFLWISNFFYAFILHIGKNTSFPKPLSPQKELEYLKKSSEGDIDARNKLVEHNLRLVAHIIKKYYSNYSDHEDLVSIGTIGLIKAINTFNVDKNIKLSSYASRCIENEILMHFRNTKKTLQDISLSDAIDTDKDGNPLTLIDILADERNFTDEIEVKINSEKLSEYLNTALDEREKKIIIMRYGLDGNEPLTQREVAKLLGISRSYISRIEKRALAILKNKYDNG